MAGVIDRAGAIFEGDSGAESFFGNSRKATGVNPHVPDRQGVSKVRNSTPASTPKAPSRSAAQWLTPPEIAVERRIRLSKVLAWIHAGELEAINYAESPCGRPRWRISRDALDAFDRARSSRNHVTPPAPRRGRSRPTDNITQYF